LLGYFTNIDKARFDWKDPFYAKTFAALHAALPDVELQIADRTDDYSLLVVSAQSPSHPPIYYLYDTKVGTLDIIGEAYPDLAGAKLGETEFVTYKASDGLDINAYVTKRKDLKLPAPTIVMVHGGPAARDEYGFDWWAQFFANRGYVVLQPQYRGSSGFGDDFQRAGDGQWGRKMNSDVVEGLDYLVAQGIADPKKVCVHGWSYGGYETMAAMTLSPDKWVCGMEGAGVADPIKMINWVGVIREGGFYGDENTGANYWKSVIGDPRTDSAKIKEISPVANVSAMKAPLLLIHGEKDITVPPEQSQFMWEAMQKAGKDGKLVILPGEDHQLRLAKSRLVFLSEMEAFLKAHNPSDYNHQ
jgi:dipeptidyl aminopeptidase/acylaminoacyl peptidase